MNINFFKLKVQLLRFLNFIPLHSCDYLQKTSIKINLATEEGKQPK